MFQSKLPIRGDGEGGGEGEETTSVTEKRCSPNQLQSGHLARWSADNSKNYSNIFPKANILEARGEPAEQIIQ